MSNFKVFWTRNLVKQTQKWDLRVLIHSWNFSLGRDYSKKHTHYQYHLTTYWPAYQNWGGRTIVILYFYRSVATTPEILRCSHVNKCSGIFFFPIEYYKMHLRSWFLKSVRRTQNSWWSRLFCRDTNLWNVMASLWYFSEGVFLVFFCYYNDAPAMCSRCL